MASKDLILPCGIKKIFTIFFLFAIFNVGCSAVSQSLALSFFLVNWNDEIHTMSVSEYFIMQCHNGTSCEWMNWDEFYHEHVHKIKRIESISDIVLLGTWLSARNLNNYLESLGAKIPRSSNFGYCAYDIKVKWIKIKLAAIFQRKHLFLIQLILRP